MNGVEGPGMLVAALGAPIHGAMHSTLFGSKMGRSSRCAVRTRA